MKKTLLKILSYSLFIYSFCFLTIFILGSFSNGFKPTSIITILIILPVLYHFFSETVRVNQKLTTIRDNNYQPLYIFSIRSFLSQKDLSFAITLILLTLSISLTALKATGIIPSNNLAMLN